MRRCSTYVVLLDVLTDTVPPPTRLQTVLTVYVNSRVPSLTGRRSSPYSPAERPPLLLGSGDSYRQLPGDHPSVSLTSPGWARVLTPSPLAPPLRPAVVTLSLPRWQDPSPAPSPMTEFCPYSLSDHFSSTNKLDSYQREVKCCCQTDVKHLVRCCRQTDVKHLVKYFYYVHVSFSCP